MRSRPRLPPMTLFVRRQATARFGRLADASLLPPDTPRVTNTCAASHARRRRMSSKAWAGCWQFDAADECPTDGDGWLFKTIIEACAATAASHATPPAKRCGIIHFEKQKGEQSGYKTYTNRKHYLSVFSARQNT